MEQSKQLFLFVGWKITENKIIIIKSVYWLTKIKMVIKLNAFYLQFKIGFGHCQLGFEGENRLSLMEM